MRRLRSPPLFAAGWLIAVGVLLLAGQAAAFCREVTLGPPNNYDPATHGCFGTQPSGAAVTVLTGADGGLLTGPDGGLLTTGDADAGLTLFPLFWRNQCVSYSFQNVGSKYIKQADAARIAAQAFATWSNAPCVGGSPTIFADPYPPVDCDNPKSQGHNNVIMFRDNGWPYDDGANAIGYTTLTIGRKTGEIFGADIEINTFGFTIVANLATTAGDAGASPDAGRVLDLGSILTHEAGHFLGLAHAADSNAVMYANYHAGSTVLAADDVAGICAIYHPDGTRETGSGPVAAARCNAAPPLSFSTTCGSLDSGIVGVVGSGGVDPNQVDSDAGVPCPDPPGCSVARASGARNAGLGACAFVALAALARRARRASRQARAIAALPLALLGASAMVARDARASVSATVLFEQLVQESSAVAVVTPTEQRAVWEGDRIVTYTHVRVDRVVEGALAREVWVRTLGGEVGDLAQIVEGQATFQLERASLVFLRVHLDRVTKEPTDSFVVVERAQGQFPVVAGPDRRPRLAMARDLGGLVSPPPEARGAKGLRPTHDVRFARDVLQDRSVDDAEREIAAAWARTR
jgi:hypothetical protein